MGNDVNWSVKKQLIDFFSLDSSVLSLFLAIFLVTLGEQLWAEYFPTYFVALGGSLIALGVFKSFSDTLEMISQLPGGLISDKIGRINSAILFLLLGIAGYFIYLVSPSWHFLFIGIIFIQGTSGLLQPTIFSIIGDRIPANKRTNAFSAQSILKRLPIVIAPTIGGYLVGKFGVLKGIRIGLLSSILLGGLGVFLIIYSLKKNQKSSINKKEEESPSLINQENKTEQSMIFDEEKIRPRFFFTRNLFVLLIADSFARFGQAMIKVLLVLHVTAIVGAQYFGILVSFQMAIAIISYLPAAWFAEKIGIKPVIFIGFLCFTLYPSVIVFSETFTWLLVGYFIAGFREFGEPARKALIVNLSQKQQRGKAVGTYYTLRSLAVIPAGTIGGLLWLKSPQTAALTASSIAFIGLLIFTLFVNAKHSK